MRILDYSVDPGEVRFLSARRRSLDPGVVRRAAEIIRIVEQDGDAALKELTRQYDCPVIDSLGLRVSAREIDNAYAKIPPPVLKALRVARRNIAAFHRAQKPSSWHIRGKGIRLGQRFIPLRRVGIYVPGGQASYPSSVLMNAVPAGIAGVQEIVMTTPCDREGKILPGVLVAAREAGVTEIYRVGGAQAIAALAVGTASIAPVDKITGPGNAYVAAAKQLVFGRVGIDMIAGPTEVVIVADTSANPRWIAADLLAQAEHDADASPICVVLQPGLAQKVELEIHLALDRSPRAEIARKAFDRNGAIIVVATLRDAAGIVNDIAPEHLEVMVRRPRKFVAMIRNAGAIFVGPWSTEALGDYVAGPNHTLPTSGTARFSSPLGVYDFLKYTNIIECSKKRFLKLAPHVEALATAEGLHGHAVSVSVRKERRP
jgi:histidinol dehydrogenase